MVVKGATKRNIFLVIKEALNNIFKYTHETQVIITLKSAPTGIYFFMQNNGDAIDFANLRQFAIVFKNMKQRMQKSAIEFTIEIKNGTLTALYK